MRYQIKCSFSLEALISNSVYGKKHFCVCIIISQALDLQVFGLKNKILAH